MNRLFVVLAALAVALVAVPAFACPNAVAVNQFGVPVNQFSTFGLPVGIAQPVVFNQGFVNPGFVGVNAFVGGGFQNVRVRSNFVGVNPFGGLNRQVVVNRNVVRAPRVSQRQVIVNRNVGFNRVAVVNHGFNVNNTLKAVNLVGAPAFGHFGGGRSVSVSRTVIRR